MRTNPFLDTFQWLTDFRWETLLYLALLLLSLVFLRMNWRADASQRTGGHLTLWAMRVLIGGMWYQGSTWKLPLPYSEAFAHWLRQSGEHAAFPFLADLVNNVMIPWLPVVGVFIYLVELSLAVSLTLGLFTRLFALVAVGQSVFLWLSLYRSPEEWPWNYLFLMFVHVAFILTAAGRSLGADALLRRRSIREGPGRGTGSRLLRLAT